MNQTRKNFSISFNPDTTIGIFGDPDGGPETSLEFFAMPCGKDGRSWTGSQFFILKGNFIKDYEKLIAAGEDRSGLRAFYDKHKKTHGSRWSSDFHTWGKDGKLRR